MSLKARLRDFIARINISPKAAPLAILGIGVLAFGLLIPALGFYWDDWPIVLMGRIHGNLWQYYASDRPFMAWPDLAFLGLAGANPLAWQAVALLVRMAAVTAFWWCLTLLWPRAGRQVLGVALLFAIHPAFIQQPLAITYKSHFTTGLLYFISLGLMLLALRKPGWKIPLVISSLAIGAVHLLTMEYFWGLELLRPVLIWMVVSEKNASRLERLKKTFLTWLPWLALFIGVVIWRFSFLGLSDDRNTPTLLLALIQSPVAGLARLGLMVLRDSLLIGVSSWLTALQPATIAAAPPFLLMSWALALASAILVAAFLFGLTRPDPAADEQPDPWARQAILVGLIALLVGMIPVWATGREALIGTYSDRYAIPALAGASLLACGLLQALVARWWQRVVLLSILVGLAVGVHLRTANEYRWEWTYQQRFLWQLFWRAPALQPGTALLSEGGMFKWTTRYSLAAAVNSLYPVPSGNTRLPYWVFELDNLDSPEQLKQGVDLSAKLRTLSFTGTSRNSLLLSFDPYNKYSTSMHCLWVLSAQDAGAPGLGALTSETLSLSNLDLILADPAGSGYPDPETFGAEPAHSWCYYFEKADLARQNADWESIRSLGDEARSLGYDPSDPYEWMPFIEGYIHVRDWETARSLAVDAYAANPKLLPAVCFTISRSLDSMTISADETAAIASIRDELGCPSP